MDWQHVKRGACLLLASALAAGCALPGWQLDIEDSAAWYGEADEGYAESQATATRYHPIVHQITPSLIRRMRQQRAARLERPGSQVAVPRIENQNSAYEVGPGDLLAIIVYGHEELTNPAGTTQSVEASGRLVDQDGEIFVPFIGEVEVAGRTLDEIRKIITEGLSRVIRQPQVDIQILKYRSKKVYITGDISHPCTVPIRDVPLTVASALAQCPSLRTSGGSEPSSINTVRLVRDGRSYSLNLARLYSQGVEPVRLMDGDRLVVDDSVSRVFIIGEFNKQLAIPYSAGGMTLADAIMAAGGLSLDTADASSIYVIRGVKKEHVGQPGLTFTVQPHVYHLDASSAGALILANQFHLQPRDIVYAAPASMVNFNRALSQILPSLNVLFRSAVIYDNLAN